MTTQNEITATEKLLDLIRASAPPSMAEGSAEPSPAIDERIPLTLEEERHEDEIVLPRPYAEPPPSGPDNTPRITVGDPADYVIPSPPPLSPSWATKVPSLLQEGTAAIRHHLLDRLRPQTKTTIAIDIQPGLIHLVKTLTSAQGHEIQECQTVPYEYELSSRPLFEQHTFTEALFRVLSTVTPEHGKYEIWCSYAYSTPLAFYNIGIPKVGEKEIANAVFWSAKREQEFDEAAVLFDYSVLQELTEGDQAKIQTLVTLAPRPEVEGIEALFKNAGFPLTGLTFPAAATQNFLNQDPSILRDSPVVYFTIRKGNSFIDLFYQGRLFFSREIKTGVDSFVESLLDQAQSRDILIDEEGARGYLFRPFDHFGGTHQSGNDELYALFDFDTLPVIDRLVRQLVRTFEYCGTTFKIPPVKTIFTSGDFTVNKKILQAIENRAGIRCTVIDPFSPAIFSRTCPLSATTPTSLLVAAGLSLSVRETTPNFLFTYAERITEATTKRVNTVIGIITIVLAVGCGVYVASQYHRGSERQAAINALRADLGRKYQAEPRSRSNDYVNQTVQRINQFHHANQEKVKRFKAMAMIDEIVKGVSPEITLTDLALELDQKPAEAQGKKEGGNPKKVGDNKSESSPAGSMKITGYITARPEAQEFILMNFLKNLTHASLLGDPNLNSKERGTLPGGLDVLRFEVTLKATLGLLESAGS